MHVGRTIASIHIQQVSSTAHTLFLDPSRKLNFSSSAELPPPDFTESRRLAKPFVQVGASPQSTSLFLFPFSSVKIPFAAIVSRWD